MEDLNGVAADCVVISCCCQCLILQILVFILLKLPFKLFKKTIEYAKKLRIRRRGGRILHAGNARRERYDHDNCWRVREGSCRVQVERLCTSELPEFQCCMDEVEKVLEDFCSRGEFGFGRFWDGEVSRGSFPPCLGNQELDYDVVNYHLLQMFGSFDCRQQPLV